MSIADPYQAYSMIRGDRCRMTDKNIEVEEAIIKAEGDGTALLASIGDTPPIEGSLDAESERKEARGE